MRTRVFGVRLLAMTLALGAGPASSAPPFLEPRATTAQFEDWSGIRWNDPFALYNTSGCRHEWTDRSPVFVSDVSGISRERYEAHTGFTTTVTGGVTTENFRPPLGASGKRRKLISAGSVVRILGEDAQKLGELVKQRRKGFLVPVEVVSTHGTYSQFKTSREQERFVAPRDRGRIYSRSLRAVQADDRFVLTEASEFIPIDSNDPAELGEGTAMELIQDEGGRFKTWVCPDGGSPGGERVTYLFRALDPHGSPLPLEFRFDPVCQNPGLVPIKADVLADLIQLNSTLPSPRPLSAFECTKWGCCILPTSESVIRTETVGRRTRIVENYLADPNYGFIHNVRHNNGPSGLCVQPRSACSLIELARQWRDKCTVMLPDDPSASERCMLQVNDAGPFIPGMRKRNLAGAVEPGDSEVETDDHAPEQPRTQKVDILGHRSHATGHCFDFRPFRKDVKKVATLWYVPLRNGRKRINPDYDRPMTEQFLKFASEWGATNIIFNDPVIKRRNRFLARKEGGHEDHIHLCLSTEDALARCPATSNSPSARP